MLFYLSSFFNFRITRQGLPTAIESEGMSFTTTLPAPMMQRSAVLTNSNRKASFYRFATFNVVNWMVRSQELAVRANLSIGTDRDYASVEHRAVVVDEDILTKFDAMPMIAMEWW